MIEKYSINDLNDDGTIKPGAGLLLAIIFLLRQMLYGPLTVLVSRRTRASSGAEIDMSWLTIHSLWEFVVCIPAVLVLVALIRRKVEAGQFIRAIWVRGRLLLLLGAVGQLSVLGYLLLLEKISASGPMLVVLFLQIYVLLFLIQSKRVKDVFSMFPNTKTN